MSEEKTLEQVLWDSADAMRGSMGAGNYMNYALGLIFYKYLSDVTLERAAQTLIQDNGDDPETLQTLDQRQDAYAKAYNDPELREDLLYSMDMDYQIPPDKTFTVFLRQIADHTFQLVDLEQAFRDVEQSNPTLLAHLFDDVDLHSTKLGPTPQKQNEVISSVLVALGKLNLDSHQGDVLGDAYEYLISTFAADTGKKAGEFYTPQPVAKLLTKFVAYRQNSHDGFTIYDPTMGSGSLLLNIRKYVDEPTKVMYYGQEINTATYNLARMNMIIHHIPQANQHLRNADTLDADWPTDEITVFDGCVMNPPYSAKWSAASGFLQDPRFASYGVLAPKSKADYAFLLHGFYHLKDSGTMAIVLPHGILFRGAAEGKIRQKMLECGYIHAVIGLPANIFYSTSIPTCIVVLKKNKTDRDVLFIDASKEFTKAKAQNTMEPQHIEKIFKAYTERKDQEKFCHLASFEEIKQNDFNLNIPRYVDTFEEEAPIDLAAVTDELQTVDKEIAASEAELKTMLTDLTSSDEKTLADLQKLLALLK